MVETFWICSRVHKKQEAQQFSGLSATRAILLEIIAADILRDSTSNGGRLISLRRLDLFYSLLSSIQLHFVADRK